MNENLINDFVNKVNELDEIKNIPNETDDEIKFFSPTVGGLELNVSSLRTVNSSGLQDIVNNYAHNILSLNTFIYDITTFAGDEDAFIHGIRSIYDKIIEQSEACGLATKFNPDSGSNAFKNLSEDAKILTMCYDLKFYLEAVSNYIFETFGIFPMLEDEAVSNDDNENDDSDVEDSRFADMLAAELVGATSGEEFTNEELYGTDNQ